MADVNTGTSGLLSIFAAESSTDAVANESVVNWELWLSERVSSPTTRASGVAASVTVGGVGVVWSGTFSFDWAGAGLHAQKIASGYTTVEHDDDGSGELYVEGAIGATGTSGAGGPTSIVQLVKLTTLKVKPGTPTSVAAVRNSDTQVTVSWSQSSASNGQPETNTVQRRINGGAWADVVTIQAATSATVAAAANQKVEYRVKATNSAGDSAWSAVSAPVFTTPAAPTGVAAAKDAALDVVVAWTPKVAFTEHQHVVEHGTVTDGVTTWDGSPLATVTAGTSTFKHVAADASKVHVYRVFARNTATGLLASAKVVSNQVQLLAAPNKPTLPALGPYVDAVKDFVVTWAHNPVDSTPQKFYEVGYSTNGGSSWSSTGKVTSTVASRTFAAGAYASGVALTVRVRTWGQAATGGADGAGASPWSDVATVTFKTRPAVAIVSPVGVLDQAALNVQLGFSQAEGATFVNATIELHEGAALVESRESTTAASTVMATRVANGATYTVKVVVRDSNGLVSDQATSTFSVAYTLPVAAVVTVTYLEDSGIGQIGLEIPEPGSGEVPASAVTITRSINGVSETVVDRYPAASELTILDTTPTIRGENVYKVTTISADGATSDVVEVLTTTEDRWAFLNTGPGYATIVNFMGNLKMGASPARSSALVHAAGRPRPIALFGQAGTLEVSGSATLAPGLGSSWQDVETFILTAGRVCYRDPSGRRVFGALSGSLDFPSSATTVFQYKVAEAS